jgi:diguanylate cyclase (GGDEF)-like protein
MKKRTRAPARAPGTKRRRKVAGTRRKNATSVRAAKARDKTKTKNRVKRAKPRITGKTKAQTRAKTTTKPKAERPATIEQAKQTIRQLKAELAQVRSRIAELQASAETDFLLDILNRRGFERALNRSIAYIKRYHATAAVILLDVDRLKPINDSFGHSAGDEVLKAVAATLAGMVRASDLVGRLGGDEFAVLLWNLSETDARAKAQALEQAIDALSFCFGGRTVTAGASAGVAILSPQTDMRHALEEADSAMYVRKAQRRHEAKAASA